MLITYIKGDATNPQAKGEKIICQINNTLGKWGKGFVMSISRKWPKAREEYLKWYNSGEDFSLGRVQFVPVAPYITVANMIGQQGIKTGSNGPPIRYKAVEDGSGLDKRALTLRGMFREGGKDRSS